MDERKPMVRIWRRMQMSRKCSGVLAGPSAKDDLESWLLLYRRRLRASPQNLLRELAALCLQLPPQSHKRSSEQPIPEGALPSSRQAV
jgi:hypothetical protein